jgi:hypothetical protein
MAILQVIQVDLIASLRDMADDRADVAELRSCSARELPSVQDCAYGIGGLTGAG